MSETTPEVLTIAHKFQIARMVDEGMSIADIVAGVSDEAERAAVEAYAHELIEQKMCETDS